ncbi:MAG: peptidoglycan DD-metalloendopeptidase family protein [Clostridiales bacterium]|jgi:murein DD-endopeptidase MepM/ murein hydrolase activator NlpD|nr:peptidoglycan DD-metalloendopeptidase family protein [Clostridiales bacterium]
MKQKNVKRIATIIAALLVSLLIIPFILDIFIYSKTENGTASAATTVSGLNSKLDNLDKEMKKIKNELSKLQNQKKSTMRKKEVLDSQISVTEQQIQTINQLIAELDKQINQYAGLLRQAEQDEKEQYELFLKRVRVMEEEGDVSLIGVLLSADSFSEFLTSYEIIEDIVSFDRKVISDLETTRKNIATAKQEIENNKSEQAKAKAKLSEKQSSLKTQMNQANNLIKSLESESAEYKKAYDRAEREQNKVKAELKELLKKQSGSGTYVGGVFIWPTPGYTRITSPYGNRFDPIFKRNKKHTGIDIGAPAGAKIVAANTGTVITAGYSSQGYGNYVIIDHGGGKSTLYAHMSKIATRKGKKVTKGDTIGYVGSTGYSTGPHLHFEVLINGDDVNPMNYFKKV